MFNEIKLNEFSAPTKASVTRFFCRLVHENAWWENPNRFQHNALVNIMRRSKFVGDVEDWWILRIEAYFVLLSHIFSALMLWAYTDCITGCWIDVHNVTRLLFEKKKIVASRKLKTWFESENFESIFHTVQLSIGFEWCFLM